MVEELSALAPYPEPLALAADYARHGPTAAALRNELVDILATRDWTKAGWPELVTGLATLGRTDVPLSRLAEGHIDALRILDQADRAPKPDALYGVWASRSQRTGVQAGWSAGRLQLNGTIRFASGAGVLDRALVPVWVNENEHLLLDLAVDQFPIDTGQWATAAMEVSRSHSVALSEVMVDADSQVGPTDFYLSRPGFFPGGVGVAACWAGGAARIADLTRRRLRDPGEAIGRRLGRIRVQLATAGAALAQAAEFLERWLNESEVDLLAVRALTIETRAVVAGAVHGVLAEAQRIAGPAGLAFDEDLTRAVHDLQLYVLQQNVDADELFLGGLDG